MTPGATALQRIPCDAVLGGDVGGQRCQPALGRGVRSPAQPADDSKGRRDIDDRRAGPHVRQHVSCQPERRLQHDVEEVVQGVVIGVVQRRRVADSGIVDQEVDVAPALDRGEDDSGRPVAVGEVDRHRCDAFTIAGRCGQFVQSGLDYGRWPARPCPSRPAWSHIRIRFHRLRRSRSLPASHPSIVIRAAWIWCLSTLPASFLGRASQMTTCSGVLKVATPWDCRKTRRLSTSGSC